ncbi:hypothetical protein L4X63_00200 [Geomonas sp. Red32]|uniref:hypothetical protein n=1 Tax=Geomonas sp. Red32 TaxID=2912856 RepID=UPI00202CEA00|nr:hypothetical protein [Geomonas sp. Red32]MCM0080002.1 hypothetical protein [Geomonas sp. Red32]
MKRAMSLAFLLVLLICLPAIADELEDFGSQMSYFYLAPSAEGFKAFQAKADKFRGQFEKAGNGAKVLTAVMIARISEKNGWPITDGALGDLAREIAKGESKLAKYVSDDAQVDPGKLDVWWASFFATGDERYLERIFNYAGLELPKGDIERLMVIGSATWSFKANCRQHKKVLEFAKRKLEAPGLAEPQRSFLRDCIKSAVEPDSHQEEAYGEYGTLVTSLS